VLLSNLIYLFPCPPLRARITRLRLAPRYPAISPTRASGKLPPDQRSVRRKRPLHHRIPSRAALAPCPPALVSPISCVFSPSLPFSCGNCATGDADADADGRCPGVRRSLRHALVGSIFAGDDRPSPGMRTENSLYAHHFSVAAVRNRASKH
jgi:hypothetical protein